MYHCDQLPRGCPLYDLALDPTGAVAAAVGQDGAVRLWDVASGRAAGVLAAARGAGARGRLRARGRRPGPVAMRAIAAWTACPTVPGARRPSLQPSPCA